MKKNNHDLPNHLSSQELKPDIGLAGRFLELLDEDAEDFTFQCYHDYDNLKKAFKLHGSLSSLSRILTQRNQQGYSICLTVNETDGKGRKKENIIRPRAIWRENDKSGLPELPEQPHIVVETSPGHFHEYYLTEDAPLDEWSTVQQRLVDDYGSDPGAKDLPRVLRVPGFYHQKDRDNPHMVSIVSSTGALPTPWEEVKRLFPPVEKTPRTTDPNPGNVKDTDRDEIFEAINQLDPDMAYDEWLKIGMALHHCFGGHQDGLDVWRNWSMTGQKYQNDDCDDKWGGFDSTEDDVITIKSLFQMANATGWRWNTTPNEGDQGQADHEDAEPEKVSMAALVIRKVGALATLYHDSDKTGYASIIVSGRKELWPIESSYFSQWVGKIMYRDHRMVLTKYIWSDVQNTLLGLATWEGREIEVHVRTARVGDTYYLDLCRSDWSVVEIVPGHWQVSQSVKDVFFRRTSAMRPLPLPEKIDCHVLPELLRRHLNMNEGDIRLLIAYLVECLIPDTEYPILELTGSPGSGKSTVQEMIREIIDPNKVNLRAAPKTVEDVFVSAVNNHLVSYNNLSKISCGMSDALCSLSTGGGHAGRKFYTNTDEVAVDIQKPVCMNGISTLAKQSDLIDRLIRITLQPIDSKENQAKKEVMEAFHNDLPQILGSLLDCFCRVLGVLPEVKLNRLPRMADFAKLCQALTHIYQWEPGLLDTYYRNRSTSFEETLENSPAVMEVVNLVERDGSFGGTVKALYETILPNSVENWVKSPRGLAEKLRMCTPALKAIGIKVWFEPVRRKDGYHVVINNVWKQSSPRSSSSSDQAAKETSGLWTDEHCDIGREEVHQTSDCNSDVDEHGEHDEHHSETFSSTEEGSHIYEEVI